MSSSTIYNNSNMINDDKSEVSYYTSVIMNQQEPNRSSSSHPEQPSTTSIKKQQQQQQQQRSEERRRKRPSSYSSTRQSSRQQSRYYYNDDRWQQQQQTDVEIDLDLQPTTTTTRKRRIPIKCSSLVPNLSFSDFAIDIRRPLRPFIVLAISLTLFCFVNDINVLPSLSSTMYGYQQLRSPGSSRELRFYDPDHMLCGESKETHRFAIRCVYGAQRYYAGEWYEPGYYEQNTITTTTDWYDEDDDHEQSLNDIEHILKVLAFVGSQTKRAIRVRMATQVGYLKEYIQPYSVVSATNLLKVNTNIVDPKFWARGTGLRKTQVRIRNITLSESESGNEEDETISSSTDMILKLQELIKDMKIDVENTERANKEQDEQDDDDVEDDDNVDKGEDENDETDNDDEKDDNADADDGDNDDKKKKKKKEKKEKIPIPSKFEEEIQFDFKELLKIDLDELGQVWANSEIETDDEPYDTTNNEWKKGYNFVCREPHPEPPPIPGINDQENWGIKLYD